MVTNPILDRSAQFGRSASGRRTSGERIARLSALLSSLRVKKLLLLAGDVFAVMVAHSLAEFLARRSMNIPATFLNPSGYYVFYVPFFTTLLYLLEGYKSHDLRRPEKELELLFKGVSFSFVALACANFVFL